MILTPQAQPTNRIGQLSSNSLIEARAETGMQHRTEETIFGARQIDNLHDLRMVVYAE
ncbi:hypothetical protein GCM10027562_28640 [Arthrobacter pigmenti]